MMMCKRTLPTMYVSLSFSPAVAVPVDVFVLVHGLHADVRPGAGHHLQLERVSVLVLDRVEQEFGFIR